MTQIVDGGYPKAIAIRVLNTILLRIKIVKNLATFVPEMELVKTLSAIVLNGKPLGIVIRLRPTMSGWWIVVR